MLYQGTQQQMCQKILQLQQKQILSFLKQNDQMLLKWNKSQLYKRWPKCMIPQQNKLQNNGLLFTGMLGNVNNKIYQYDDSMKKSLYTNNNVSAIKNIEKQKQKSIVNKSRISKRSKNQGNQGQIIQQKILDQIQQKQKQNQQQIIKQGQFKVQIAVGDNNQNIQGQQIKQNLNTSKKSITHSHQSRNSHSLPRQKTQQIKQQQIFSPFLPNRQNPFDRNVNTKILKQRFQKTKIDPMRRNIVALIEQQKCNNTNMRQQIQYGKSLPKRSTDSININDILRYTLGLKRDKQQGVKPQPIKNPFVRVPSKYYQSLGDFYHTGQK